MKQLRLLIALGCTLLAISACVVEPYGGGGRGPYYSGGGIYFGGDGDHHRGDRDQHDYGRRVWRE